MKSVLFYVLSRNKEVAQATDHYFDDVIINLDKVTATKVIDLLKEYGLVAKPPEKIIETSVLGLEVYSTGGGKLRWKRAETLELAVDGEMSRREVFSWCGKVIVHFPVAGWLRVAPSFVKRSCGSGPFNERVGTKTRWMITEMAKRIKELDPVGGVWNVHCSGEFEVWCDASSIAHGVVILNDEEIFEDGAWIRKDDDGAHINLAELNAVIKGVNMVICICLAGCAEEGVEEIKRIWDVRYVSEEKSSIAGRGAV